MKFICTQKELSKRTAIALKAIPSKTTMAVLQNIYIEASEDGIRFFSNDLENGIVTQVDGTVESGGSVSVEASLLANVVRTFPDNDVTISVDENYTVNVDCEKTHFTLPGRSGDDFTLPNVVDVKESIAVNPAVLKKFILQTVFSVSHNDANKIMTGVLVAVNGNEFSMTALDGHRVAIRKTTLGNDYGSRKAIISGRTLLKLKDILSDYAEKDVLISLDDKQALFGIDDTNFTTRLIDGEYFNVEQMISLDHETEVSVGRKSFLDGVERAMTLSDNSDKKPIIFNISDNELEIKVNSAKGSMRSAIPVAKNGKDLQIGFNPRFITEALKVIEDDDITIYFTNAKAPCFIYDKDKTYTYLILPVNFKGE